MLLQELRKKRENIKLIGFRYDWNDASLEEPKICSEFLST